MIKSFSNYGLTESFSYGSTLIGNIKLLEKKLKSTFSGLRRWDGPSGYQILHSPKIGKLLGILYILKNPRLRAFRLIYGRNPILKRDNVIGVQIWKTLEIDHHGNIIDPTCTILLNHFDILDPDEQDMLLKVIVPLIKAPSASTKTINIDDLPDDWLKEESVLLTEAPHMSAPEFVQRIRQALGDMSADAIAKTTLFALAKQINIGVPGAVRGANHPSKRGFISLNLALDKPVIKVVSGPSQVIGRTEDLTYKSVVQRMREEGKTPEEIVKRTDDAVRMFTRVIKAGQGTLLIISGVGGTGKTFLVRQILGDGEGETWNQLTGTISSFGLYKFLFENRDHKILVFDDCNIFQADLANILKGALNDAEPRYVSWSSKTVEGKPQGISEEDWIAEKEEQLEQLRMDGEEHKWKAPNKFRFQSQVVIVTNKPMKEILEDEHLGAVASRAIGRVDYDFNSQEILAKMAMMWKHIRRDVDEVKRSAVFDMVITAVKGGEMSQVTMRTLSNAFAAAAAGLSLEEIKEALRYQ